MTSIELDRSLIAGKRLLAAVSGARSGSQVPAREATASFWDAAHAHPACAP